jgi:hypothetical protein
MSNSTEESLMEREPAGILTGRSRVIRNALSTSLDFKAKSTVPDPTMNDFGRAIRNADILKKEVAPQLLKVRRQVQYLNTEVAKKHESLVAKAKGKPIDMEAIWAQKLLGKAPAECMAYCLNNATARGVALRQSELLDLDSSSQGHLLKREIRENHEREGALLQIDQQSLDLAKTSVNVLEQTIMAAPVVTDRMTHFDTNAGVYSPPSGQVRRFHSTAELDRYLAKEFPTASAEATISEKIDADYDEAA